MAGGGRLDPEIHPWMRAPETRSVMDALNGSADEERARFVGGCVRNALMGRPVDDVDIATVLQPADVIAALEGAGLKAVPTGLDHGTVTGVSGGRPFEITTLREDVETHGRRAVVAFTTDWAEDAARRDFRLNAIYASLDGALFDPFDGAADVAAGRVVFIGEARERIAEDYLRILRFYRFNAWYAEGAPDREGHAACVEMRAGLSRLSAERVWKELKKLLAAPAPERALKAMQEGHVLNEVFPGELDFNLLLGIIHTDERESLPPDPLLRVAALCGADAGRMTALSEAMKASNAERARFQGAAAPLRARTGLDPRTRRAALYRLGPQAFSDQIRLAAAGDDRARAALASDLDAAARYQRPVMPVRGRDLVAAGFAKGPELGETLERLERAWIASDFTLDKAALLKRAGDDRRGGGEGER